MVSKRTDKNAKLDEIEKGSERGRDGEKAKKHYNTVPAASHYELIV